MSLTAGVAQDRGPRWAPDSHTLYFLSDRITRGIFQIYRIALTGGEAEVVTDWDPGIAEIVPLSSKETVVFLAIDPETPEDKRRKEQRDDAEVYGERWPAQRLRLLHLDSRSVTTVEALGSRHIAEAVPSPDGDWIAVIAWPTPELDNSLRQAEILVVDVAAEQATPVCRLPAGGSQLAWGPDGNGLLFLAHLAPDWRGGTAIFAVDPAAGTPRKVTEDLPACPMEFVSRNGSPMVLVAEGLDSWIGRLNSASGRVERVTDLPGEASCLSMSADSQVVALARSLPDDLSGVWAGVVGEDLRRLTDLNPNLRSIAWGRQERLAWQARDGLEIQGLLILPPGAERADGPFPVVTLVHGGPYARYADALQLGWMLWGQWLANAGYAIFLPNPRGGLGRGHDFADRVAGAVGIDDWADIEAGLDQLVSGAIADPARLGIGGWSQGGFMSAWAVGRTDRFAASIVGAGVSDWGMMVATSDLPHFEAMLGGSTGWEGPGPHHHDTLSPISFAGRVTTPVLVLHGADDARVPVSQGRFFAQALRQHGVPCELVVYPREGHLIRERNHQRDLLARVRDWVERWLGPGFRGAAGTANSHQAENPLPVQAS
jgi:dipeptidyl aminopeptidase/acylaminoacyl peptidase